MLFKKHQLILQFMKLMYHVDAQVPTEIFCNLWQLFFSYFLPHPPWWSWPLLLDFLQPLQAALKALQVVDAAALARLSGCQETEKKG